MIGFVRTLLSRRRPSLQEPDAGDGWDLSPADRIGAMPARSRDRRIVRTGVVITAFATSTYLIYQDPTLWSNMLSASSTFASSFKIAGLDRAPSSPPLPRLTDAPLQPALDTLAPLPEHPLPPAQNSVSPSSSPPPAAVPEARAASPERSASAAPSMPRQAAAIPYAPPEKAIVEDPYESRAKAAGLSPDLSRALLSELSAADYRNARIATETALAKTPDDGIFRWPQKREPGQAMFEVRFVTGAADNCRRYVVTVEKKRWLTTAQPVEKCGIRPVKRQASAQPN